MSFNSLKQVLLPVLSGILLFCAFPRANLGALGWIALTPLIWQIAASSSKKAAFFGGFITGLVSWFGLIIWIPRVLEHYGGIPTVLAWGLQLLLIGFLSCYPAVVCLLSRFCIERGGVESLFVFPFAWVVLEFVRGVVPFGGFPWLLAGYSQSDFPRMIQVADITGVYGISFLLLWINTALVWFALRRLSFKAAAPLAAGLILAAGCLWYGQGRFREYHAVKGGFTAALLQQNLSFDEPQAVLARQFQQGYVEMASRLPPQRGDLLVLPESPSPLTYQTDNSYRKTMSELAQRFPLGMIFNNISYTFVEGGVEYFNSAYFLNGDGREIARYDKIHLVPFGEYVPLRKVFFFIDAISKDVGGFTPGHRFVTAELDGHPSSAIICFEAVFPELVRQFVLRGSELLVSLTNDAWYGNSSAPYQHLAMSRWRAVENRRFVLRAANSGISAVIDPSGAIRSSTPLLEEDICLGSFAFLGVRTFYTRYGDAFVGLCAIIMVALIIRAYLHGRTNHLSEE